MISYKTELQEQLSEVEMLLEEADKRLKSYKNLEEGTLRVTESHGFAQYHFRKKGSDKEQYIPTYEKEKIYRLAQRDYDEKVYKLLADMQNRLSKFIKGYNAQDLDHIYERMCKGRKQLVNPIVFPDSIYIEKWMDEHKGGENSYGEATSFKTLRGEYVRSKSEKIIADYFYKNHIPYQYEPRYEIYDFRSKFPDFVVLNVRKRKTLYWEHLGRVGELDYATRNFKKLMDFEKSGLIVGDNLIITMETLEQPLDVANVEEKVRLFLQ